MPKIIKKKTEKASVKPEQQVKTFMAEVADAFENNLKKVIISAAVVLCVALLAFGYFLYTSGQKGKAKELFYAGYKKYHGPTAGQPAEVPARFEGALESFRESYEVWKSPLTLLYMANSYYALGRYDDAIAKLDELTGAFPEDDFTMPLALYKKAVVLLKSGKAEEALGVLETLYNSRSESYKDLALLESARILEALERSEEAAIKYELILSEYPESPFAAEARVKTGKDKQQKPEEEAKGEEG